MRVFMVLAFLSVAQVNVSLPASTMSMGDGTVDGNRLKPYQFTWMQCAVQDETWLAMPELTESLALSHNASLVLEQHSTRPDGSARNIMMIFDSFSFAPRSLKVRHTAGDGTLLAASSYEFTSEGYTGKRTQGGETQQVSGSLNSSMFAATTMGLPLATLPWQEEPLQFLASMISFDGSYNVTATWAGKELLQAPDGGSFEAFHVDVKWQHRESGDIYPSGPDASGGRYWLVADPPDGVPPVIRYKTDTYAVEFFQSYCPG